MLQLLIPFRPLLVLPAHLNRIVKDSSLNLTWICHHAWWRSSQENTTKDTWRPLAICTFFVCFPKKSMDDESQIWSDVSLLAVASFPCIQRAGEKRPLPWVESVCVEHAPRFLSDQTMTWYFCTWAFGTFTSASFSSSGLSNSSFCIFRAFKLNFWQDSIWLEINAFSGETTTTNGFEGRLLTVPVRAIGTLRYSDYRLRTTVGRVFPKSEALGRVRGWWRKNTKLSCRTTDYVLQSKQQCSPLQAKLAEEIRNKFFDFWLHKNTLLHDY